MSEVKELSIFELVEGKVYENLNSPWLWKRQENNMFFKPKPIGQYYRNNEWSKWKLPSDPTVHVFGYIGQEPISKPVTAEQVREAFIRAHGSSFAMDICGAVIKELGLE